MVKVTKYKKQNGNDAFMYRAYFGVDPLTGKEIRKKRRGFESEKAARAAYKRDFANFVNDGPDLASNIKTFNDLYEMWLAQYRLTVKASSVAVCKRYCEHHVLPKFGRLPLDKITVAYCQKVVNEWHEQYRQFNFLRKQASQILRFGVNQEIIKSNPMTKVTIPKEKERMNPDNFYNREQVHEFLSWAKKYPDRSNRKGRLYTFFRLLAYTGMRKSEALALQWRDIDFNEKTVSITKTLATDEFENVIVQGPKTINSNRTISLDDQTLKALKKYQLVTLATSEGSPQDRYIFLKVDGTLCYPQIANEWIRQVYQKMDKYYDSKLSAASKVLETSNDIEKIKKARIDVKRYGTHINRITPHGFRHTHASLMFESAISANIPGDSILKEVMNRLGHKDIKTTMNIYAHVTESSEKKVSTLFVDFMNEDPSKNDDRYQSRTQSDFESKIKKL